MSCLRVHFSIRTVLILVAVLAVFMAMCAFPDWTKSRAISALKRHEFGQFERLVPDTKIQIRNHQIEIIPTPASFADWISFRRQILFKVESEIETSQGPVHGLIFEIRFHQIRFRGYWLDWEKVKDKDHYGVG